MTVYVTWDGAVHSHCEYRMSLYKVPSVIDWMLRVVKSSPKLEMAFVAFWISSLAVRLKIWPSSEDN